MNLLTIFNNEYVTSVEKNSNGLLYVTMTNPDTGYEYVFDPEDADSTFEEWLKDVTDDIRSSTSPVFGFLRNTPKYADELSSVIETLARLQTELSSVEVRLTQMLGGAVTNAIPYRGIIDRRNGMYRP
jgi:hypothetical protein